MKHILRSSVAIRWADACSHRRSCSFAVGSSTSKYLSWVREYVVPNIKSRWHDIQANVKLRSCFWLLKNFEKRSVERVLWPDYVIPKCVTSIIRVYKIVIIIITMEARMGSFCEADRYSLFIFIKNVIQFKIVCASIKYVLLNVIW